MLPMPLYGWLSAVAEAATGGSHARLCAASEGDDHGSAGFSLVSANFSDQDRPESGLVGWTRTPIIFKECIEASNGLPTLQPPGLPDFQKGVCDESLQVGSRHVRGGDCSVCLSRWEGPRDRRYGFRAGAYAAIRAVSARTAQSGTGRDDHRRETCAASDCPRGTPRAWLRHGFCDLQKSTGS